MDKYKPSTDDRPNVNYKNFKCLLVNTLRFFPYKRCPYCDLRLSQCFGGFRAPLIITFIMVLIVLIIETNNSVVDAVSMVLIIASLILLVKFSNTETTKLTINNYHLNNIQKSLRLSEKKYYLLYSNLPGGSFTVDYNYTIMEVNDVLCKITGYSRDELIGQPCNLICPKGPHKCPIFDLGKDKINNDETAVKTRDKVFVPIIKSAIRISIGEVDYIVENFQDISDYKNAEEKIMSSLKEKDVLLKEIHHRVKNNLQIISSLLYLQFRNVHDEESVRILKDSQSRIKSMVLIHEQLYKSKDLSMIQFSDYINNLAKYLFHSLRGDSNSIKLVIDSAKISLSIDAAINCGMIINELISNAMKHAFPINHTGFIHVLFHRDNDLFNLIVKDSGVGFPQNIDFRNTGSLGLQLVCRLTEQLDGDIELRTNNGTEFKISFTESDKAEVLNE